MAPNEAAERVDFKRKLLKAERPIGAVPANKAPRRRIIPDPLTARAELEDPAERGRAGLKEKTRTQALQVSGSARGLPGGGGENALLNREQLGNFN